MAQPYVGEIRLFAGNFAPAGWQFCEGQLLPISENETLFQLIGTTYGGFFTNFSVQGRGIYGEAKAVEASYKLLAAPVTIV